jgi:prepilin-type N-terminal cleavage/methylation domain-containing protein
VPTNKAKQKAYTLIELLLVLSILSITVSTITTISKNKQQKVRLNFETINLWSKLDLLRYKAFTQKKNIIATIKPHEISILNKQKSTSLAKFNATISPKVINFTSKLNISKGSSIRLNLANNASKVVLSSATGRIRYE